MTHRKRTTSNRTKKRKSGHVRFNNTLNIHHIPHHNTYTLRETSRIWYQISDYDLMDEENDAIVDIMTINMMENDNDNDEDDDCSSCCSNNNLYCTRGLEGLVPTNANKRDERRNELWDAVMDEQFYQWEMGIEDPKALAKICRDISRHPCERIARLRGLMDEQEALTIHASSVHDAVQDHRIKRTTRKQRKNRAVKKTTANIRNDRRQHKSKEDCQKNNGKWQDDTCSAIFNNSRRYNPFEADDNDTPLQVSNYYRMRWSISRTQTEKDRPLVIPSPPMSKRALCYSWKQTKKDQLKATLLEMATPRRMIVWE